jgi:hypothetical protein
MTNRTICLFFALTLAGCSGPAGPAVGTVTGTVTFDGQPVPDASIQFVPKPTGRTSTAVTDAQGKYTLLYDSAQAGALVGKHLVRVTTAVPAQYGDDGKVIKGTGQPEKLPERYNTSSEIEKEVKAGANVIDLTLTK